MNAAADWIDRAIFAFVRRVSGRVVALVALAFYPGFALVMPLAFGWTPSWLINANLIGVMFAALVRLGWLFVQMEAKDRRHLLEWTTDLRHLTAQEFEWLVGELFRREGWTVKETGSQDGPDGNVDLELTKGRVRRLVQCKRWTSAHVASTTCGHSLERCIANGSVRAHSLPSRSSRSRPCKRPASMASSS